MKSVIPHPKRLAALIVVGVITGSIGLEIAGHLLLQQGFVTILVRQRLASRTTQSATSTPEMAPPEPDRTRPIAAMIDNHPDALPQSGIDKAAAVYEAPVEGSLTRLMAVFRSGDVGQIGPIRSARPYFLDWAAGNDAVYAHFGGSDEALADLRAGTDGLNDVDGITAGATFWRDGLRAAPHNAYTSTSAIRSLIAKKGWPKETAAFDPNLYDSVEPQGIPTKTFAVVHIAGGDMTRWTWNASVQAWLRSVRGNDTITRDGKKILPKTVVVIETKKTAIKDPQGKGLIGIAAHGSGKATVLRDGVAKIGVWKKPTAKSPIEIFDADGKKITFAIGQVWYEIIAANAGGTLTIE